MRRKWTWRGVVAFSLLFYRVGLSQAAPVEIGATELRQLMDTTDIQVIFPLSPIEFQNMHIPGSINIPLEELEARLPADKEQRIAFYCLGRT